ncbi:MAG: hypothetical protein H8E74_04060 [Gammaproteobacteria bacterium]|nr:hypothetical protein [Gammaproteobacteria bacterium]
MSISKSSFLNNYKNKIVSADNSEKINEAIRYAFKLTDMYGIEKINKTILEASIEFKIDENVIREKINDESFILDERNYNE